VFVYAWPPMPEMDFSSTSVEGLYVDDFQSEIEKQKYLDAMFAGEIPIPPIYKAMGVDFTGKRYVDAVLRKRLIGVLSAAAPGHEVVTEDMRGLTKGARISKFLQANMASQREQIDYVRERNPYGILGENAMLKLTGYRKAVRTAGESKKVDFTASGAGMLAEKDLKQFEQFPHMGLIAIVSSVVAARGVMRCIAQHNIDIKRIMFCVEDPNTAGGHLGAKEKDLNGSKRYDPVLIAEQLEHLFPHIPRILAGGIAYRDQYNEKAFQSGYQGGGIGIRGLFNQESELTQELMEEYYFNRIYETVVNGNSPTGYIGRYLNVPRHVQTPEEIDAYVRWAVGNCVACINMKECTFLQAHVKDGEVVPDLESEIFCIGQDLPRTTRGEKGGTVFSSTMRDVIIDDEVYYDADGKFDCPSLSKSHDWWTSHDAPKQSKLSTEAQAADHNAKNPNTPLAS